MLLPGNKRASFLQLHVGTTDCCSYLYIGKQPPCIFWVVAWKWCQVHGMECWRGCQDRARKCQQCIIGEPVLHFFLLLFFKLALRQFFRFGLLGGFAKAEDRFWKDRRAADKVKMKKKLLEMDNWLSQGSLIKVLDSSRQESSAEPQLFVGKGQLLNWSVHAVEQWKEHREELPNPATLSWPKSIDCQRFRIWDEWTGGRRAEENPFDISMSLCKIFLTVEYLRFITFLGSSNFSPYKRNTGWVTFVSSQIKKQEKEGGHLTIIDIITSKKMRLTTLILCLNWWVLATVCTCPHLVH